MASDRKTVWFNLDTEQEEYEFAESIKFSTEVKRWIRERIARKKLLQLRAAKSELTVDLSKLGGDKK